MPQSQLFEKIRAVRESLCRSDRFGPLIAERYMISGGDLIGHRFCFEKAEIKWQFESVEAEIWVDGNLENTLNLDGLEQIDSSPITRAA